MNEIKLEVSITKDDIIKKLADMSYKDIEKMLCDLDEQIDDIVFTRIIADMFSKFVKAYEVD